MYVKLEERETRCLPSAEMRLDGDESPKIVGYAAVFNTWADIGGWFRESIRPGAFRKTIKENDIRALLNHDENFVLGRNKAGTLKLREDDKGLAVEIDPVPASWANDLLASMRRGDVSQMSFGFTVNKQEIDEANAERTLVDVTLFDVSVVTFPAYPTTSAQVRSVFEKKPAPKPLITLADEWEALDALAIKIKSGAPLTQEERTAWTAYLPTLSEPPAQHSKTPPAPPAQHAGSDTRDTEPRWIGLVAKVDTHYAQAGGKAR